MLTEGQGIEMWRPHSLMDDSLMNSAPCFKISQHRACATVLSKNVSHKGDVIV